MCRLIVSDIIMARCPQTRIEKIGNSSIILGVHKNNYLEKWTAVADICRCLHNYNGVIQVCAAFTNSSVYRLRKTWERVSKTVSKTIFLVVFLDQHYFLFSFRPKTPWIGFKILLLVMEDIEI